MSKFTCQQLLSSTINVSFPVWLIRGKKQGVRKTHCIIIIIISNLTIRRIQFHVWQTVTTVDWLIGKEKKSKHANIQKCQTTPSGYVPHLVMLFQTAIRDFSHGSFQMTLFLSQHKPFLSYICIVPWKVWLKGYGSYNYNIYWTRSLFIFFSPVWKYCIVTQERINMSFCTERDVIGHLGAHWEEKPKERKKK